MVDCQLFLNTSPIDYNFSLLPPQQQGRIYERKEIEQYMEREGVGAVSPVTKEVFLSDDVYPCGHFLDTIKHLVDTGVIDSKLADPWKVRLGEHEEMVAKMKSNAESGDVSAMYCLGEWYWNGLEGFKEDKGEAYNWYTKASDRRFPKAMARVGQCLLNGSAGATTNTIEGIVLLALLSSWRDLLSRPPWNWKERRGSQALA